MAQRKHPKPVNIREINIKPAIEEQCLQYIEQMRWPDGIVRCPAHTACWRRMQASILLFLQLLLRSSSFAAWACDPKYSDRETVLSNVNDELPGG